MAQHMSKLHEVQICSYKMKGSVVPEVLTHLSLSGADPSPTALLRHQVWAPAQLGNSNCSDWAQLACTLAYIEFVPELGKQNKTYSKILFERVNKHLHISPNGMYIMFQDLDAANVGWNSTTF
ncbi:macrophage migration inhibitory factor-like [Heterodontus francisci]|uniref:macrophage migration inhibitory factor-like n=1 Tax=Heterodontus francisci TaxID=7792 RepID=UPI00355BB228